MNIYYSIDDVDLSDGPVIVNMIVERATGQQIVSSLAPDAVVEEFDSAEVEKLKGVALDLAMELEECGKALKDSKDSYETVCRRRDELIKERDTLIDQLAWAKAANWQLRAEFEECKRVRDKHYHDLKRAREDGMSLREQRDNLSLECDKLKAKLEAAEKSIRAES